MADQRCQEEYIRRIYKVQDYMECLIGTPLSLEELSDVKTSDVLWLSVVEN